MTLIAKPILASDGILIDTNMKQSPTTLASLYAAGVRARWGYVFFGSPRPQDLDAAEVRDHLNAKVTLLAVQHVPITSATDPSWHADGPLGVQHAAAAIANAIRAGYVTPDGSADLIAFGLDMEAVRNPGPDSFAYAQVGCRMRFAHRYRPVVYLGYACGLTVDQCNELLDDPLCGDPLFWIDFAQLAQRPSPKRNVVLHQQAQTSLAGVGVDKNTVMVDGMLYGLADVDLSATGPGDPAAGNSNDPAAGAAA